MKNIEIDTLNKEVNLQINTRLYTYDSIILTSKEFSDNFWVNISKDINNRLVVNLKPKQEFINDINLNELGYEFYNFILGKMQET